MPAAILIVNYRVYRELDRALSSVEPFLRADDEVVVVDHGTDAGRLARIAAAHPRAACIGVADNPGFSAGVNLAARRSSAPYLMLLNPDAVLTGPVISTLEAWLQADPRTVVVGPRVLDPDGRVQASGRRFPGASTALAGRSSWLTRRFPNNWLSARNLPGRTAGEAVDVDWLAGSCFMTRREVFDRVGGFDETFFLYWEDADFCRRATRSGGRCVYLPTVSVRHTGGSSMATDPAPAIRAFHASASRFQRKHAGPVGRVLAPLAQVALWLRGEILVSRTRRTPPRI